MKKTIISALLFLISLTVFAQEPNIVVRGNGKIISDGSLKATAADNTQFGTASIFNGTIVRSFNITNEGTDDLFIFSVDISGPQYADFCVTLPPPEILAAGTSTNFQITFYPTRYGRREATVTIFSNDPEQSYFNFVVEGTGDAKPVNQGTSFNTLSFDLYAYDTTEVLPAIAISQDRVTVQSSSGQPALVTIYDTKGQLVISKLMQGNFIQELSVTTPGIYVVFLVTQDGQQITERVMVRP